MKNLVSLRFVTLVLVTGYLLKTTGADADGIEVAAQLEADWALHGVPIVFLTSLISADEAKDGRRVYGHRILPKPTSSPELIELIEQNLPCCAEV